MAKTVKFDKKGITYIVRKMNEPIDNARPYFNILGLKVDQSTQNTFRNLGARGGNPKWKGYSPRTLHPSWTLKDGTGRINWNKWNKRRGTDNAKTRRYSASSRMMQASGDFRKSVRVLSVTNDRLTYGTRHQDAEEIISARPVLFVTQADRKLWHREFIGFYNRGLKF